MSRNKNLIFIIAVLLLTNIAVLLYFLAFKKPQKRTMRTGGRGEGISELLQKEVGFTDDQVAQYKQLKEQQKQKMRPLVEEMRKAKDSLFRLMSDSTLSDSVINNIASNIGDRQSTLDLQTFIHFREVRNLCSSEEQKVKYDSAILKMFRKMGSTMKKGDGDNSTKDNQKN